MKRQLTVPDGGGWLQLSVPDLLLRQLEGRRDQLQGLHVEQQLHRFATTLAHGLVRALHKTQLVITTGTCCRKKYKDFFKSNVIIV